MKHTLYTIPDPEKQLLSFKAIDNTIKLIRDLIFHRFEGYSSIKIQSEPGNGNSYLLHAIANSLKKKGQGIAFLNFKGNDQFSDLTPYHLNQLMNCHFVFMDNVELLMANEQNPKKLIEFIGDLERKDITLIYACHSTELPASVKAMNEVFSSTSLIINLPPISDQERIKWAECYLEHTVMNRIQKDLIGEKLSNAEFIKKLDYHIKKQEIILGTNYEEIREQYAELKKQELRLLQNKLAILELEPLKLSMISKQEYELAATLREQERELLAVNDKILNELTRLNISPKPSKKAMEVYVYFSSLVNFITNKDGSLQMVPHYIEKELLTLQKKKSDPDYNSHGKHTEELDNEISRWESLLKQYV